MNTVRYIKSFSKGQITIPKELREIFGIGDEFWLKLYISNGRLIAEPVEEQKNDEEKESYRKKLLGIKGDWFDEKEFDTNRKQVEARLKKLGL